MENSLPQHLFTKRKTFEPSFAMSSEFWYTRQWTMIWITNGEKKRKTTWMNIYRTELSKDSLNYEIFSLLSLQGEEHNRQNALTCHFNLVYYLRHKARRHCRHCRRFQTFDFLINFSSENSPGRKENSHYRILWITTVEDRVMFTL